MEPSHFLIYLRTIKESNVDLTLFPLSFINIAATSNCLYFYGISFGINFVNDSDTTDFISVFPLEFAVQLFDMRTEKWLLAEIIDTLVYPSFCISILFFIVFVSNVRDQNFIHLL